MKWGSMFMKGMDRKQQRAELEEHARIYQEVLKAQKEWERAHLAFQTAVGKDEVDVAIYTLEAAERRYQIQLKEAKRKEVRFGNHAYTLQDNRQSKRGMGL